ncbi:hypothetical protein ANN_00233 [Periplaneta americana]|uniref:Carboxylic ester hydrolase n=1 Tax=Periplaneta americana TaxID=6978 RepID=A0ABQ8TQD2_PERAM|nr:hypothetical protein ANN_00233 [Periplaneta americana]
MPASSRLKNFYFQQLFSAEGCGRLQKKLVTIEQGVLRGSTMISQKGKPFCAFRAIPFALPPVGRLRFQPPHSPKPWSGILHATDEPPVCIQVKLTKMFPFGQEDCLYLNVYTTRLKPLHGKLLDVMVWLYPGVFYFGSNLEFEPHYLMDRDILLVMPNHRVGAFGFLSTGDDEAPGNYGLKDQVAALRWVQENIAAFGGNASSVTIFGVSSGAASVHFHMMSPLSKGLFHRAMSLEGTAINPWARSHNPLKQAQKQARVLGCPTDNTTCLVQCLKEVDAVELAEAIKPMFVKVFENKVLRKIFGAKRDEVAGEWRKLHNTELHALYSSPDIIRNIKSKRLKWAGHVARMGESRNAYRVLVGRPEGKRPLGRPRCRWEDNIKMDLIEVGYDSRDWINLAQDRDRWRAYVRAAMNLRVPYKPFVYMDLPASGYAPVVERKTERNPEPFLTKNPLILLQEGSFERVPWMMGGSNNGLCMSVSGKYFNFHYLIYVTLKDYAK